MRKEERRKGGTEERMKGGKDERTKGGREGMKEEWKNGRRRRREVVRDVFGYQITEKTRVLTNMWFEIK